MQAIHIYIYIYIYTHIQTLYTNTIGLKASQRDPTPAITSKTFKSDLLNVNTY